MCEVKREDSRDGANLPVDSDSDTVVLSAAGRLGKLLTTGELYENPLTRVPTTAGTVTTGDSFEEDPCGEMQVRVDRVTHDTVSHLLSPIDADGDVLVLMKFMPVMLTVSPPVLGELTWCARCIYIRCSILHSDVVCALYIY